MIAPAVLVPGMRVRITAGRFAGEPGPLIAVGPQWAAVDLGVAIDRGNGVIVVRVSTVHEAYNAMPARRAEQSKRSS